MFCKSSFLFVRSSVKGSRTGVFNYELKIKVQVEKKRLNLFNFYQIRQKPPFKLKEILFFQ